MIRKLGFLICLFFLSSLTTKGQTSMEMVLSEIEKNNPSIYATQELVKAKKWQYKTDLFLENPFVEFEYLNGSPKEIGNQTDLLILQSFDFPTVYKKKKEVSNLKINQTNFLLESTKRKVILEAKQTCIAIIFHKKMEIELERRLVIEERLQKSFQKKMEQGEATILDVNKFKLQLIFLKNKIRFNASERKQLNAKLIGLNAGIPIFFNDSVYQIDTNIPKLEGLLKNIDTKNPALQSMQQGVKISQKKIDLAKALALPKLEGGYRYQGGLGQQFHGIHLGLTIPLWENKNKVIFQEKESLFAKARVEAFKNTQDLELNLRYNHYENLKITLAEYKSVLSNIDNSKLLEKSLRLGEISSIEYLIEVGYFNEAIDKYLEFEKAYYLDIVELMKFE